MGSAGDGSGFGMEDGLRDGMHGRSAAVAVRITLYVLVLAAIFAHGLGFPAGANAQVNITGE
jgi:hypothetical protein